MRGQGLLAAGFALLLTACGAPPAGDAARGEALHKVCLDCHGTDLYRSPQRKIGSREALRKELHRWGDYYNPALTEKDIDDLAAYLERDFYRF